MSVDNPWLTRTQDAQLASFFTEQLLENTSLTAEPVDIINVYETSYTLVRIARRMGWAPT